MFELHNVGKWVNTFGLGLDIVGVLLLWKFGLGPRGIHRGPSLLAIEKHAEEDMSREAAYDWLSLLGIICLVTGFLMQAGAGWLK